MLSFVAFYPGLKKERPTCRSPMQNENGQPAPAQIGQDQLPHFMECYLQASLLCSLTFMYNFSLKTLKHFDIETTLIKLFTPSLS